MNGFRRICSTAAAAALALLAAAPIQADTIAWWRFEEGISGAAVQGSSNGTVWRLGVEDVSGNGNHLTSRWDQGNPNVTRFAANVPPVVSGTNILSMQNTGGTPSLFTWSAESKPLRDIETMVFDEWTIEAFFNSSLLNSHRTMVGRDGEHPSDGMRAALYFKTFNNNVRLEYGDPNNNWYTVTGTRTLQTGRWYYYAATCNGNTLRLYLADLTAGETVATLEAEQAITGGDGRALPYVDNAPNAPPNPRASWSVGRGWYNSGETDYFMGYLDEVRISDRALNIATEGLLATGLPVVADAKSIDITSPANNAEFPIGTTVTLTAIIEDDETIEGPVVFSVNGTTVGLVQAPPYTMDWMPPKTGFYSITVIGYDGDDELIDRVAPFITVTGPDYDITAPNVGTVTASSELTLDNSQWDERATYAFDNNVTTFWTTQNTIDANGGPHWIAYQLTTPRSIDLYALTGRGDLPGRVPGTFELQGSNNGTDWTVIDSQTGHATTARTEFMLPNPSAAYTYYRLWVTSAQGGTNQNVNLVEFELIDLPVQVRLSGSRPRINLSTPDATDLTITATPVAFNGQISHVQFFDGVRSLGYGTPQEDGTFTLTIYPQDPGMMSITALAWVGNDVVPSVNTLPVEVALFVNQVPTRNWTLY